MLIVDEPTTWDEVTSILFTVSNGQMLVADIRKVIS